MKICIITEFFPKSDALEIKGGAEACAFNEAKYLAKKHDVTVITSYEPQTKRKDNICDINVIRCGNIRNYVQSGSLFNRFTFMLNAYKTGKKEDFDIITGYNYVTYPIAWRLSKKLKKPCAIRYHDVWIGEWVKNFGLSGIFGEITERYVLSRNLDMILSVSSYTKNNLQKYFNPEKIAVIPNIVDIPQVKAQKFQNPTISCVSRLVDYKRVDDLLQAVAILKETIPDIKCKIVGTGPKKKYLKELTANLDINNHVDFCGFVEEHDDVMKIVKSSHVFCLPSIIEGFGIVIVESMGLGVPFVASNIPPLVEASGGVGGLFFEPKNYDELADKIKIVLKDKELQNELHNQGLDKSREYIGTRISAKIEDIYENLIKNYKK
ncbi:MAG: glycosyltransferase family 4 protein [Methanobacterium sp.]